MRKTDTEIKESDKWMQISCSLQEVGNGVKRVG